MNSHGAASTFDAFAPLAQRTLGTLKPAPFAENLQRVIHLTFDRKAADILAVEHPKALRFDDPIRSLWRPKAEYGKASSAPAAAYPVHRCC